MTDWKAALVTWHLHEPEFTAGKPKAQTFRAPAEKYDIPVESM
jgi:hypothetical protein